VTTDRNAPGRKPERIAILGGGPAGLAAAYQLTTAEPGRYDITVYEMSWRLGGKTASGRGQDGRIEEHGLHVLFGGYHNTFRMMIDVYRQVEAECGAGTLPCSAFLDAVVPGSFGVIGDDRFAHWQKWDLQFPINSGVPGDPPLPTTGQVFGSLLQIAIHLLAGARVLRWVQRWLFAGRRTAAPAGDGGDWFLRRIILPGCRLLLDRERRAGRLVQRLGRLVQRLLHASERPVIRLCRSGIPPRIWTLLDLLLATCRGICRDQVLFRADGYSRLDRAELRAWLRHHGARRSTLSSPFARVIYEATFQGFFTERIAAGVALRILLWMSLTYKGAMYYKMKGGTGDVINLPLYLLLRQRGVKFAFFHKVRALRPGRDAAGAAVIDGIDIIRLARPLDGTEYDPLINVGGHRCWPSAPVEHRIRPEDRADAREAESFFHRLRSGETLRLQRGQDFDQVVFAIPVACIPFVCEELCLPENSPWRRQQRIEATQTVALQLWDHRSLTELGWRAPPPLLSLFWDPLNTWCDMGQVLPFESWADGQRPRLAAYFCGPLAHRWPGPERWRLDPARDRAWRQDIDAQAEQARQLLLGRLSQLWPAVDRAVGPVHTLGSKGWYLRANYDPHARCTLALPRQSANRISADDTGYANLTVAGDWTANHILVACLEGTVQSAVRAARAVSRRPELYRIIGEELLEPAGARSNAGPPPSLRTLGRFVPGQVVRASRTSPPSHPPETPAPEEEPPPRIEW
jgi:uncharacterized protein with NAD-binding domain and iron-sulfur cluster